MSNVYGTCDKEGHTINKGKCITCKEPDYSEITKATMNYVTYTGEGCDDTPEGISKDIPVGFTPSIVRVEPVDGKRDFKLDDTISPNHYTKWKIAPNEYITANNLEWEVGNCIKYVTRYKDKNGKEDLLKAIKYIELLIERKYGKENKGS